MMFRKRQIPPLAALWLTSVAMLALSLQFASVNLPGTHIRLEPSVLCLIPVILASLPFVPALQARSRLWALAGVALTITVVGAYAYRPAAAGDYSYGLTHTSDRVYESTEEWYEPITVKHPVYGFGGKPDASGLHLVGDRLVRYLLDVSGWRQQQKETMMPDEIWFLGSDLAFGLGVMDGEGFVDRLASVWRDVKVRNFSHKWWSTANAYRVLEEQIPGSPKPRAVILAWSSRDRFRNFRRKSWFQKLPDVDVPVFDVKEGKAVFLGLEHTAQVDEDDGPFTDQKERRVTEALLRGMAQLCAKQSVPFIVLALHDEEKHLLESVRNEPNLKIWDLSDVGRTFTVGGREWHQAIAHDVLTADFLAKELSKPSLQSPDSYPRPKTEIVRVLSQPSSAAAWRLEGPLAADAKMTFPTNDRVKIDFPERKFREWWDVRLVYPVSNVKLKAGENYSLEYSVRSKELKQILSRLEFTKGESEVTREATTSAVWQNARQLITAQGDFEIKQIVLSAGRDSIPFEVRNLRLYSEKSDIDLLSPSTQLPPAEQPTANWLPSRDKVIFWSAKWYNNAVLEWPAVPGAPARITQRGWAKDGGMVQIQWPFALKKGSTYSVHMDLRSPDPRSVGFNVIKYYPPWTGLCEGELVLTNKQWQRIEKSFFAAQDEPKAALTIFLGGSDKPVEIRSLQILEDGRNILLPAAKTAATASR